MQTFRFRLARVLEWYTRQYELEERCLTACLAALADAKAAIASLLAEHLSVEREMLSRKSIPANEFAALGLYRLGVKKRGVELDGVRERCQADVEAQRLKLRAAERRLRLVEKLRERRLAEYTYAESRELEELASDAFFSKWAAR
jgi:flagellar export protein FliJ